MARSKYAKLSQNGATTLRATVGWSVQRDGSAVPLDGRVPVLLREVARTGTLTAAARLAGIPYRSAWAAIAEASRDVGVDLVELARGRGATLTALGTRLLAAHEAAEGRMAAQETLVVPRRAAAPRTQPAIPLRVAASHDIALAELRDRWRLAHGVLLDFHGSAESLDAFRSGTVDVAGFHVERGATREADPLLARLDPARDALVSFITRAQGLIVPRGNPRRLRSLAHVVARDLTIVNRQAGSGTRLLLDRLLARARIDPARVRGYPQEEFTHAAVAATVASGRADAALGIQAAAAQFGLSFVPLAVERYCFACRRRALDSARIVAFRELLTSDATRAVVAPLPGYVLDRPGEEANF